jgi:DNA-binding transcriptional regulator LsrR (DeoR family)
MAQLRACEAVGDIALRLFDVRGQPVEHEICGPIIGLDLDQMRRILRAIGVAGGCPSLMSSVRRSMAGSSTF